MKRKLFIIVALLGLMLSSGSLWAYAVPTLGQQIASTKSSYDGVKTSLADLGIQQQGLLNDIASYKYSIDEADVGLSLAKQAVIDYTAEALAQKGHPVKVKAANDGIRSSNQSIRDYLALKQTLNGQIVDARNQISVLVASALDYKNQLTDLNTTLRTLQDAASRCGYNSISIC